MARLTIAGRDATAPGGKQQDASAVADRGGDSVVIEQFTREFNAVLRQVKEAHVGRNDATSRFNADGDVQVERRAVAHFGVISQRLLVLVRQLIYRTDELVPTKKQQLLLLFGDKFASIHEYHAADRYFYAQIAQGAHDGDELKSRDELYARAALGRASCQFQIAKRVDPFVRFPGTLATMLGALQLAQQAMAVVSQLVRESAHAHSWLLLNGSVVIYSIARPLQLLGFEREVVAFFKWSLLCLESTVMLSTTKYVLWRLQFYSAVCECYEAIAVKRPKKLSNYFHSAVACAEHASQVVARLRKEEELDLPLSKVVAAALKQAELVADVLVARCRALAKGGFGRQVIESLPGIQDVADRFRLAMNALASSKWLPRDRADTSEMIAFAVDMALQLLKPLRDSTREDSPSAQTLQLLERQFALAHHMDLVRHGCLRRHPGGVAELIECARTRLAAHKDRDVLLMELHLHESLLALNQPATADAEEKSTQNERTMRDRLLDTARALKPFVVSHNQGVPSSSRDTIICIARRLWTEGATEVIRELDALSTPEDVDLDAKLLIDGIVLLEAIYSALRAVDYGDMVLLGEICLRFCLLLTVQQNWRKAIRTLRDYLRLIDDYRDRVTTPSNHFKFSSYANKEALSRASFSFEVDANYASSDCSCIDDQPPAGSRQAVGVEGTGSQLGGLYQELSCIQVDVLLLLFKLELQEAATLDGIHMDKTAATQHRPLMVEVVKTALQKEFKNNMYARVLLNIESVRRRTEVPTQDDLANESFKLLRQAECKELELVKNLRESDSHQSPSGETLVPRAPRIIVRNSSSVCVEIIPFKSSSAIARRRSIAYYMIFAKPSGAGTYVSLNNSDYCGTGEPVYLPETPITVAGLSSNTSYVFAVAAFDESGEVIQGIGETSKPVDAINPLPLVACYGYLAQVLFEAKIMAYARQSAMQVYNSVVSKEFADRPGWASNIFYRHALKRRVIARWPVMLLSLVVQCVFVLCDDEEGDTLRDGQLTSDGSLLRAKQITVLEMSRMVAIGLEVASAAGDHEHIRALVFKGYRTLLPLLHLEDSNAVTFAALSTYYQALWCIPCDLWDTDTRSIAARIAFELMRTVWRHHNLVQPIFSQVAKLKTVAVLYDDSMSTEMNAVIDYIALAESAIGRSLDEASVHSGPATAPVPSQAEQPQNGKGAQPPVKPVASSIPTPPVTARVAESPLPRLSELITQSRLNLREAIKLLEPFFKTSRDSLEILCKLCRSATDAGDYAALEEWLPHVKVSGTFGTKCKEILRSAGLADLLPEPELVIAPPTASAPSSARSAAKTPRSQDSNVQSVSEFSTPQSGIAEAEFGADDEYLYTWCGEICLMQASNLFQDLACRRFQSNDVDCFRGPTQNYASEIFVGEMVVQATPKQTADNGGDTASGGSAPASEGDLKLDSHTPFELFGQVLARASASCRLFALARAWGGLQTAAQYVANSIWHGWISPEILGQPAQASILDDLAVCVDSVVEMIEFVTSALKDEQAGRVVTTLYPQTHALATLTRRFSTASTTVVVSALSSLDADQAWISNLVEFTLQSLLAAKKWNRLVQLGKKYHLLSGSGTRFSEKMLPVMVYAQRQFVAEQIALVSSGEREMAKFIKAFHDAEAKKKKKKSRLVVEEDLTAEEVEFRNKRGEMECTIQQLTQARDQRRLELDAIELMCDTVSRTTNKCTLALDTCRELLEMHRRQGASAPRYEQIVTAFSQCVALARQKRQRRVAGKALQELGDFLWGLGDVKGAVKAWNEAVDNAFNTLRATSCWRDVIGQATELQPSQSDAFVEGDGLWICLESCIALMKLILFDSSPSISTIELARMAAATFSRIVSKCSLPHPSRPFMFGAYQIFSQLWPGRELLVDPERLDTPRLALMFSATIQVLLQYEQAAEAMPMIAGYEYLASQCFEDIDHVADARRLRIDALVQCGRFHEAFEMLAFLISGLGTGNKPALALPHPLVEKLIFRDDKPIQDASNSPAVTWMAALDITKVYEEMLQLQHTPETARMVLVSILKLAVGLAQHEGIEEESNSTCRQIASKMATSIANLLNRALQQLQHPSAAVASDDTPASEFVDPDASAGTLVWESFSLTCILAEVLLQQTAIATSGGQWSEALAMCMRCVEAGGASRKHLVVAMANAKKTILSLDSRAPLVLILKPSTLIVRARLVHVKISIAQREYRSAINQVDVAVEEARLHGENGYFVRHLNLLRAQAWVQLGHREAASREIATLQDDFISSFSRDSPTYVELLRMRATLLRDQALECQDAATTLEQVRELLEEAEDALDRILRRDGWIGTDVAADCDKRLNLYHPCVGTFVALKAEVVQGLMEAPADMSVNAVTRAHRAMLRTDIALNAIDHSAKSLTPTKVKLFLLKGAILKKRAIADNDLLAGREELVEQCVSSLKASIEEAIRADVGLHDRELLCLALMELVDLYEARLIPGRESEHLQAAFHFLNLARLVRSCEQVLFDSLELHSGTITNADKLPGFINLDILKQDGTPALIELEPVRTKPVPAAKGGSQTIPETSKRNVVDAQRLVSYFIKILREVRFFPACAIHQQDVAVMLHHFLVRNHSSYANVCCLQSLPPVPQEDPEIKGGVICTHWLRDLTPGIGGLTMASAGEKVSMFFILGTTRADGHAELVEISEGVRKRVESFATSPLLSKRGGLAEGDIQAIGEQLSRLRLDMEDADSLIVDRFAFPSRFRLILGSIQELFRIGRSARQSSNFPEPQTITSGSELRGAETTSIVSLSSECLLDTFNVPIPVNCTLDSVRALENVFHIERGVSGVIDNALCYFLRDLLDN